MRAVFPVRVRGVVSGVSALLLVTVLLVAAAVVLVWRFEQLCLRDLASTPDDELRLFTRSGWITLILVCIPFAGVLMTGARWR